MQGLASSLLLRVNVRTDRMKAHVPLRYERKKKHVGQAPHPLDEKDASLPKTVSIHCWIWDW